ncbi:hypothetical protein JGU66_00915 [Myxococcaceae bacterium JPH2]|nr:hypothetical protein [Myxococcaceae bacterium JPH2]
MFRPSFLRACLLLALASACRESPPPAAPPSSGAPPPAARPVAPVAEWGTLEGSVRLSGPPPAPVLRDTSATAAGVCGEQSEDRSVVVGQGGTLAYAVVSLKDGAAFAAPPEPTPEPVLDQRKCSYEPPALAARAGSSLALRNSDPLVHNVRAASAANRSVFNVAMPLEGMTLHRPLPTEPGTVAIRCDVHPWMHAVVRTFDHPYFTTSGVDGRFRLKVPAGKHTLVFWHERLPETSRTVDVHPGETVTVDQAWGAADLR